MKLKIPLLFLIISLLLVVPSIAYALEFYVETDKSEYYFDETITLSGEVDELAEFAQAITILIVDSDGNIVTISQIIPNGDKTFSAETYIPEIYDYGTYTISANYLSDRTETTFEIIPTPIFFLEIDQTQYSYGDRVYLNGAIPELGNDTDVTITITNPNNELTHSDIIRANQDLTFEMNFDVEGGLYNEMGTYTIDATYEEYNVSITFETITSNLIIDTDQSIYYEGSIINISGIMSAFDVLGDQSVLCDLYYENGTRIEIFTFNDIINMDGTFDFTVNTIDRTSWDYTGDVELQITIQDHTSTTHFEYINEPNMTNEALYEMILDIYRMLAEITDDENIDQQVIVNIKGDIIELGELIAPPPPTR